ncbi:TetR/AcrR family transcriptional regulator [Leisingera sp. ANG-Vp]|uniref:TetR/AcrR family transcriptional regulator n=1 Tax=Leisingera sp. ANG-Vp TaxID=1577896 RepID=UPI00057C64CA|nr:TetR/AcrR family transcriptional regulator [Leisingera sp. ANG-Vp]KIC18692.1 TetR family transcriptional regulator [Leisingera sp. ANG-Vp]
MNMAGIDPKQQAVLTAAWTAFSTYGFRKTSMDDIAKGAGMSRPAVYLHFKNKEAILRALVQGYYARAQAEIAAALAADADLKSKLAAAFAGHGGEAMEAMMSSPHGMELLETSVSVAGESIEEGEAALSSLYANWLTAEAEAGRVSLPAPPADMARVICACLKGIKKSAAGYAAYRTDVSSYAALCAQALEP